MRRRTAVTLSLALLAVAALLARSRRKRTTAPLTAPASPRPPAGVLPTAPGPAESRFVSVPWTLASDPADDAELAIRCHQSDELVLDRVDVQETPTQVFLTAIARREPRGADEPLRAEATATVVLSHPLGERELIATPVDEPDAPPLYP